MTLRQRTTGVVAAATLVAIMWYATFSAGAESRLLDFARLAQAQDGGGILGGVAHWWLALSAVTWRYDLAIDLVQAACIPVALLLVIRRTGAVVVAVAAALVALALTPASWLGRPLGVGPALGVLGSVFVFAGYAGGGARARRALPFASFIAVLSAGWPTVPIVVLALSDRSRITAWAALGAALGVVVRILVGIAPFDALGVWSTAEAHAFFGLRLIFWLVVFVPALLFVVTRPAIAPWLARLTAPGPLPPLVIAAAALGISGTFLVDGSAALFAACVALLLVAGLSLGAHDSRTVRTAALVCAAALVFAGTANRVRHPTPDDAQLVAADQRAVRAAAAVNGSLVVVDRGEDGVSRRFPPSVLSYLAGRPIAVRYAAQPSSVAPGGVVEATARGLVRIDPSLRALHALDDARRSVRYDFYVHRLEGTMNSRRHEQTPSGFGVIPSFALPGPDRQVSTITVLSGYTLTFDHVAVRPKSRLVFVATKPSPVGNAAGGTVTISIAGQRPVVAETDLPPADPSGLPTWEFRSIPLDPPRTTFARVVFSASSPSGYDIGDWASFGMPGIVSP